MMPDPDALDTAALLAEANAYAQRRFAAMLDAKAYSDPEAPETRAYVMAEAIVRELMVQEQWEKSKAEFDALQTADLAAGDHFVYPTHADHAEPDEDCADCQEISSQTWEQAMQPY